jgi:ABC-type cobalamin transport system permease subunit
VVHHDLFDDSPLVRPRKNALVGVVSALAVWVVPVLLILGGHLSVVAVAALAAYGALLLALLVNRARRAARRRVVAGGPSVLLRTPVR